MYVCMYVCMYIHAYYVCIPVYTYVRTYVSRGIPLSLTAGLLSVLQHTSHSCIIHGPQSMLKYV